MSAWVTTDMAAALPDDGGAADSNTEQPAPTINPQAHGWTKPVAYNYITYNGDGGGGFAADSGEDAAFDKAAQRNCGGDYNWAGNAAVYEFKDEYGDVPPRIPELEDMLFGKTANHSSHTGSLNWEGITNIPVTQEGQTQIRPVWTFEDAGLHPVILENIKLCGYNHPTPVQSYTLPAIKLGHDIIACAQTGSGKTAAFLIPILSRLMGKAKKICAPRPNPAEYDPVIHGQVRAEPLVLIVVPTRELAVQIFNEARKLCYRSMLRPVVIYGGTPLKDQIAQLAKGADILIATTGRLVDFINRPHILSLRRLRFKVIDEADELLQNDWESDMKVIMTGGDQEPGNITYLMFSATFEKGVRELAKNHLKEDHVRIRVGRIGSSHTNIKQDVVFVEPRLKKEALLDLLMSKPPARTIVFVNSKRGADELDDFLFNNQIPCTSIHGDRTQREREDSIRAFTAGTCPVLIASGVTARGIDVDLVMHVINYDLPSHQHGGINEYIHRIGRTGRSGRVGWATAFYTDRDEDIAPALVKAMLETRQAIPDFLECHIPEGFTADGHGDIAKLQFDDDSDNGEDEAAGFGGSVVEVAATPSGAWGTTDSAPAVQAAALMVPIVTHADLFATVAPAAGGWGGSATASNSWGTAAATSSAW